MTEARKMKLTALAAQPDAAIDLTEIPELPESFWKNAVRNPFLPANKAAIDGKVGRRCGGVVKAAR